MVISRNSTRSIQALVEHFIKCHSVLSDKLPRAVVAFVKFLLFVPLRHPIHSMGGSAWSKQRRQVASGNDTPSLGTLGTLTKNGRVSDFGPTGFRGVGRPSIWYNRLSQQCSTSNHMALYPSIERGRVNANFCAYTHKTFAIRKIMEVMRTAQAKSWTQ